MVKRKTIALLVVLLLCNSIFSFATNDKITYFYLKNGTIEAYPEMYVSDIQNDGTIITVVDSKGMSYSYATSEVVMSEEAPKLPTMVSFKFNNKFNDMLMEDAIGEFVGENSISVSVGGIGKRLVPSFQLSDNDAVVYVGNEVQISKVTSQRYDSSIVYTVTHSGYAMLQQQSDGTLGMCPFGRDYVVNVDFLCDHPTTAYGVPEIYITTDDGTDITSKEYYLTGTIRIDGAGYFPNMEETAMNIKGRGNMSWTDFEKKSYRIKFNEKQKPLGMTSGKNWNIIACAQAGSMMTNVIGSRVSEMIGTDGANHFIPVELYFNGEYRGSYTITENIGLSNNSIDLDDESSATLLELDKFGYDFMTDAEFDTLGLPVTIHYPDFSDEKDVTNLTMEDITTSFNRFITALRNGQDVSKYLDFPSTARYLMLNDLIVNYELMHPKSMYCYNENVLAGSLYHFGPTWDFDWGYGYETAVANADSVYFNYDATIDYYETTSQNLERKSFPYSLRYSGEEMNKQYYRVWHEFVCNDLDYLCEYCTDYYNVASKSFTHNDTKWQITCDYQTITDDAIAWLRKRATYVYDYLSNTLGYADKNYLELDEKTAIVEVKKGMSPIRKGIYDVQGRQYNSPVENLPQGIYVINGKMVWIHH